jgi:uncharacterized protein involved in exopolysaccharide biosynthesis
MRREIRARWLAAATAIVVVILAALFAAMRNAPADYISLQSLRTTAMQRG